ncbi:hypothetical protein ACC792_31980 [Rhizobium ruizarguesonis]
MTPSLPLTMGLPEFYVRGEPIHVRPQPLFSTKIDEFVEYLWHHSAREAAAGSLCALNVVEHNEFALDFYVDFISQAFDEYKHAFMYWDWLREYLDENHYETEFTDKRIIAQIDRYRNTGAGLEIPAEGAFYEAFYHASLIERLFIMQIDTEGGGVRRFNAKLQTQLVKDIPRLEEMFREDLADERYHVRIGSKWIKALIPERADRKIAYQEAMAARNYLMLLSTIESHPSATYEWAIPVIAT